MNPLCRLGMGSVVRGSAAMARTVTGARFLHGARVSREGEQTYSMTGLALRWREAHPDCPLVISAGSDVAKTHPSSPFLQKALFPKGYDATAIHTYGWVTVLSARLKAQYGPQSNRQETPEDSTVPGGAIRHMVPTVIKFGFDSQLTNAFHNVGRALQCGRVSVTPRSQENLQLGTLISKYYRDDRKDETLIDLLSQFDRGPSHENASVIEARLVEMVNRDISNESFGLQLPQPFVNLYATWSQQSSYDTEQAQAFRQYVLGRQKPAPVHADQDRSFDVEEARYEMERALGQRLTDSDLAQALQFGSAQDYFRGYRMGGTLTIPFQEADGSQFHFALGDAVVFGGVKDHKVYKFNDGGAVEALSIRSGSVGAVDPETGCREGSVKFGGREISVIVPHAKTIEESRHRALAELPILEEGNPLQYQHLSGGRVVSRLSDGDIVKDGDTVMETELMKMRIKHLATLPEGRAFRVTYHGCEEGGTLMPMEDMRKIGAPRVYITFEEAGDL